jgi:hypothetical protein
LTCGRRLEGRLHCIGPVEQVGQGSRLGARQQPRGERGPTGCRRGWSQGIRPLVASTGVQHGPCTRGGGGVGSIRTGRSSRQREVEGARRQDLVGCTGESLQGRSGQSSHGRAVGSRRGAPEEAAGARQRKLAGARRRELAGAGRRWESRGMAGSGVSGTWGAFFSFL